MKPGDSITSVNTDSSPRGMPQDLWQDCVKAGEKYGVDPFVLAAQAKQESSWGQNMANGDGVMQVQAATRGDNAARRQVMNTTTPANPIRLKWPP